MTISAPSLSGFCKNGDRKVLSTTTNASHALASFDIFLISTACNKGFDGVSTHIKSGLILAIVFLQKDSSP